MDWTLLFVCVLRAPTVTFFHISGLPMDQSMDEHVWMNMSWMNMSLDEDVLDEHVFG